MHMITRILLALAVILVDLLVFFLPLSAFFVAYVLIFNPLWFRDFLSSLNGSTPDVPKG